jgi:hypothetical protein
VFLEEAAYNQLFSKRFNGRWTRLRIVGVRRKPEVIRSFFAGASFEI